MQQERVCRRAWQTRWRKGWIGKAQTETVPTKVHHVVGLPTPFRIANNAWPPGAVPGGAPLWPVTLPARSFRP
jgi:hypothetical protein